MDIILFKLTIKKDKQKIYTYLSAPTAKTKRVKSFPVIKKLFDSLFQNIEMTEEQAREIFKEGCRHNFFGKLQDIDKETEDIWIERIKQAGYIRKSVVEEAEEMYFARVHGDYKYPAYDIMSKMWEAIQELKEKLNDKL